MGLDILSRMGMAAGPSAWASSLAAHPDQVVKNSLAATFAQAGTISSQFKSWGE
jgi:hypothetical protein